MENIKRVVIFLAIALATLAVLCTGLGLTISNSTFRVVQRVEPQIGIASTFPMGPGNNIIGQVTVTNQMPLVAGNAIIGSVTNTNQMPLVAGNAIVGAVTATLANGSVITLSAGNAIIGQVTTTNGSLVGLLAGNYIVGSVTPTTQLPLVAGNAIVGSITPTTQLPLVAGNAIIGSVTSTVTAMPANSTITGTIIVTDAAVSLTLPPGASAVALATGGTWTGQVEFEATNDNINWGSVEASNGVATVNTTAGNDLYILPGAAYTMIRGRASALSAGTILITITAGIGSAPSILTGALPAGGNNIGDVDLTASELHIGEIGGRIITSTYTFARPADALLYAVNDAINVSTSAPVPITFTNVSRIAGGGGEIMKARLVTDATTYTARIRLLLYNYPPTAINDNAVHTVSFTLAGIRVGPIDFPALSTEGTGSTASMAIASPGTVGSNMPLPFLCATGSRDLYGLIETLDAFNPITSTQFLIELTCEAY